MDVAQKTESEQKAFFQGKSVLVVVPHPDDEINTAGGLIAWLYENAVKVSVLYTTNANYRGKGKKRIGEAIGSITALGGLEKDVYWLGYSDQSADQKGHFYTQEEAFPDRHGRKETYLCDEARKEFCFWRHNIHREQNRANFIADLKECVEYIHADVIFCVDFDSHPDHRATSLAFEHAMGEILSEGHYFPLVFKTFAYPTAYNGRKDLFEPELKNTVYCPEKYADPRFENPYYKWEERARFEVSERAKKQFLPQNIVYTALKRHNSQNITERADRIINGDQVAWPRRTDNLLLRAVVRASSGEARYLRDFLLFDCSTVLNGYSERPVFDEGAWIPAEKDAEPEISICFSSPQTFDRIVLYRNSGDGYIQTIGISLDGLEEQIYSNRTEDLVWKIPLRRSSAQGMKIRILSRSASGAGLTEIEVLDGDIRLPAAPDGKTANATAGIRLQFVFMMDRLILFYNKVCHSIRRRFQKMLKRY